MATKVYTDGRIVGTVDDGEFRKRVQRSKHMLRQPPAWCLSVESLEQAEAAGARVVVLHETEDDIFYSASIATINRYGQRLERGGYEPQIRLELRYWTRTRNKPNKGGPNVTKDEQPAALFVEQMALF